MNLFKFVGFGDFSAFNQIIYCLYHEQVTLNGYKYTYTFFINKQQISIKFRVNLIAKYNIYGLEDF